MPNKESVNELVERIHSSFMKKILDDGELYFSVPVVEFSFVTSVGREYEKMLSLIEERFIEKGYSVNIENVVNVYLIKLTRAMSSNGIQQLKAEWLMSPIQNSEVDIETARAILSVASNLTKIGVPKEEILLHLKMIHYGEYYYNS